MSALAAFWLGVVVGAGVATAVLFGLAAWLTRDMP